MTIRFITAILFTALSFPFIAASQQIEKIVFDNEDSASGYYLAIAPKSKQIKGTLVLLTSFQAPENLLSETKLHNVAYANDLLMVVAPMKQKLYADSIAIARINTLLRDIIGRFRADTAAFALAGYDEAGNIALRYTELTYEHPSQYPVQPKAVFGIDTAVDLFGLWHWSERQIKKNFWPGAVGDAQYYISTMTKENGTIYNNAERYKMLSPFYRESDTTSNEQYLKNVAVRLYYDTDVDWQLKNRRNSLYDTKMPDGSELINRLLLLGNSNAAFVASKQAGTRSNGTRHPNALSIVDEVDCIHWLKKSLGIFDAHTWVPPYRLTAPEGWGTERFALPAGFASAMTYKGVEDIRFAPGWEDSSSEGYWSYTYLWWLKEPAIIDASGLQQNLKKYYSGLVDRNVSERKIPENKQVATTVTIKKVKAIMGDVQTFGGRIQMLDYMTQRPMVLNVLIHVKECGSPGNKAVFVDVSPKPYMHSIWSQFDKIRSGFSCVE